MSARSRDLSSADILWNKERGGTSDADVRTFCRKKLRISVAKNFGFIFLWVLSIPFSHSALGKNDKQSDHLYFGE